MRLFDRDAERTTDDMISNIFVGVVAAIVGIFCLFILSRDLP